MLEDCWLETEKNMHLAILLHHSFALYPPWLHFQETSAMPSLKWLLAKTIKYGAWSIIIHYNGCTEAKKPFFLTNLEDGRLFETP